MRNLILLGALSTVLLCACAPQAEEATGRIEPEGTVTTDTKAPLETNPTRAIAELAGKSGSKLTGRAAFTEEDGRVTMMLTVEDAEPGTHAVHIHQVGDCSAADASSAGPHWNPTDMGHGHLGKTEQAHLGDIGNFEVDQNGTGRFEYTTDKWVIGGGAANDILGHALVVHAKADDYKSQPAGDAGDRIGCGVIAS